MKRMVLLSGLLAVGLWGCELLRSQIPIADSIVNAHQGAQECDRLFKQPVPIEEEVAIGDAAAVPMVQRAGGLFVDLDKRNSAKNDLHVYVNRVGKNLAAQSERPELAWSFGVIDSESVNAFATPGGRVFVTRGLLKRLDTEAELAGVLGHEIAHVVSKHGVIAYKTVKKDTCNKAVIGQLGDAMVSEVRAGISASMSEILKPEAAGFIDMNLGQHHALLRTLGAGLADQLIAHGYDASDEFSADIDGMKLAMGAGYSPTPFIDFLGTLPEGKDGHSNHPKPAERQRRLRTVLAEITKKPADGGFPGQFGGVDVASLPTVPLKEQLVAVK